MKTIVAAASLCAMLAVPALADTPVTGDAAKMLTEAAAAHGYSGGKAEKEDEGSGVYEIDDAKAKDGTQYDLKFDKDFKLLSVTRD